MIHLHPLTGILLEAHYLVSWGLRQHLLTLPSEQDINLLRNAGPGLVQYGLESGLLQWPHRTTVEERHERQKEKQRQCMRRLRDQRRRLVKQMGRKPSGISDHISHRGNKADRPDGFYRFLNEPKGADESEWPEDLRVREMPE